MSYVDAILVKDCDRIKVAERTDSGRRLMEYPTNYTFYFDDERGKYRTIYDTPVSKFSTHSSKEFYKELKLQSHNRLWESDINVVNRCLEDNYRHVPAPKLHVAFFDIETNFDLARGFSMPDDPFSEVTAVTVYLNWLEQLVTLALVPPTLTLEAATELAAPFDNTFLFTDEKVLLNTFLDLIDDADILSGWNSEGYDIPYMVNRICKVLSKNDTRRLCLWEYMPKSRTFERYGAEQNTFDLIGRIHLDYMQLYRKYTYEERHSYSLDAIGEFEIQQHKTPYAGSLDQLYKLDFGKFIEYNRQDVMLLYHIDQKLQFIDLASEIAHSNTVLIPATMGSVQTIEQAIINEAHDRGLIVQNRKEGKDEGSIAGAYVATPVQGLHDYIGAIDINSLYPSGIRMLNMAPETIVGQLRPTYTDAYIKEKMEQNGGHFADAWDGLFGTLEYQFVMDEDKINPITIDWENGTSTAMTGAEIYDMLWNKNKPWMMSANGTMFTLERKGVIPELLSQWYAERKTLQKTMREMQELSYGIKLSDDVLEGLLNG